MSAITRALEGIAIRRSSDAEAFDRALRGDSLAFAEVYRRYHDRIFAFCLSRLLSREAANDAVQEVFLRALSADASRIASPGSWLYGVARHVCIDVARTAHRDRPADADDLASDEATHPAESAAEDAALSRQAASSVLLGLRRLNPRYRSALILREIHQQPMTDVADSLGVTVPTAYTILSRARDAFGKTYAEVLGLPDTCRRAVELVYRRTGTGISESEALGLESHLTTCPGCRREAARASGGKGMRALLPLLPWASIKTPGILTRAAAAFGSQPWPAEVAARASLGWTMARVATATVLAAGMVAAAVTSVTVLSSVRSEPAMRAMQQTTGGAAGATGAVAGASTEHVGRVHGDGMASSAGEPTQAEYRLMRGKLLGLTDMTADSGSGPNTVPGTGTRAGSGVGAGTGMGSGAGSASSSTAVRRASAPTFGSGTSASASKPTSTVSESVLGKGTRTAAGSGSAASGTGSQGTGPGSTP